MFGDKTAMPESLFLFFLLFDLLLGTAGIRHGTRAVTQCYCFEVVVLLIFYYNDSGDVNILVHRLFLRKDALVAEFQLPGLALPPMCVFAALWHGLH